MRCSKARKLMSAALDGELAADRRETLDRHLGGCADCRAYESGINEMAQNLAAWDAPEPRWGFTDRLTARLPEQGVRQNDSGGWLTLLWPARVGVGALAFSLGVLVTLAISGEANGNGTAGGDESEPDTTEYVAMLNEDPVGQLMTLLPAEETE